jgi:hypothetical protein
MPDSWIGPVLRAAAAPVTHLTTAVVGGEEAGCADRPSRRRELTGAAYDSPWKVLIARRRRQDALLAPGSALPAPRRWNGEDRAVRVPPERGRRGGFLRPECSGGGHGPPGLSRARPHKRKGGGPQPPAGRQLRALVFKRIGSTAPCGALASGASAG